MADVTRYTISIENDLASAFDDMLAASAYDNRSKFFADLLRERLRNDTSEQSADALGSITLLYDHHRRGLLDRLMDAQHEFPEHVLCSTHVHLDHDTCCEIILVRGKSSEVRQLYERLKKIKGVLHATLGVTSAHTEIEGHHH